MILTLGVFLQVGLGYTALHSALATAPWAVGALFGSAASAILMGRLGRRVAPLGLELRSVRGRGHLLQAVGTCPIHGNGGAPEAKGSCP